MKPSHKIFTLFVLFTVFAALNGSEFFHKHSDEVSAKHCYACILSHTIKSSSVTPNNIELAKPEFGVVQFLIGSEFFNPLLSESTSERAPPAVS